MGCDGVRRSRRRVALDDACICSGTQLGGSQGLPQMAAIYTQLNVARRLWAALACAEAHGMAAADASRVRLAIEWAAKHLSVASTLIEPTVKRCVRNTKAPLPVAAGRTAVQTAAIMSPRYWWQVQVPKISPRLAWLFTALPTDENDIFFFQFEG